jgi:hypothetical protein
MFDLNGEDFQEKVVKFFNNGVAGKVDNTVIKVEKKTIEEADNVPDYRVVFADSNGATVNAPFYYNDKNEKVLVSRALHVARAVMGKDYKFPTVNTSKEAVDSLMKLIRDNAGTTKFSTFVNYGTIGYANKYLKVRYFDFIELSGTSDADTRLFTKKDDLLTRLTEDSPSTSEVDTMDSTQDWV